MTKLNCLFGHLGKYLWSLVFVKLLFDLCHSPTARVSKLFTQYAIVCIRLYFTKSEDDTSD
jgi:hypothetical protein